jgi:hypothetical protein
VWRGEGGGGKQESAFYGLQCVIYDFLYVQRVFTFIDFACSFGLCMVLVQCNVHPRKTKSNGPHQNARYINGVVTRGKTSLSTCPSALRQDNAPT